MNILNTILEQLSPELLGQIGRRVGESPEATKSALDSSLQALLGSAVAKSSLPEGATSLFNLLKDKAPQGAFPASAASLLGNTTGEGQGAGSSLVSSLLGSKANMLRDFIASRSGIRGESASSLLGAGGHLLMEALGGQMAAQGLGASGFGQLLRSQIPYLQRLVSPELAGILGIGNLLNPTKAAAPAASYAVNEPAKPAAGVGESPGARVMRFAMIPLLLLLGVIFLALRHSHKASEGGTSEDTLATRSAGTVVSSNLDQARIKTINFTDRLKAAIASADGNAIDLEGVNFESSGTLSPAANNSLASLGKMINDNPSLKVTITSYGQTAEEASSRANAIRSALVKMGITTERIAMQPEIGESLPKVSFTK